MTRYLLSIAVTAVALSTPAAAKDFVARSYCPMAHVIGIDHGKTLMKAENSAIAACVRKGGIPACCNKFIRQIIR